MNIIELCKNKDINNIKLYCTEYLKTNTINQLQNEYYLDNSNIPYNILYYASYYNNIDIVEYLLSIGLNTSSVYIHDSGNTLLEIVASNGYFELLNLLINKYKLSINFDIMRLLLRTIAINEYINKIYNNESLIKILKYIYKYYPNTLNNNLNLLYYAIIYANLEILKYGIEELKLDINEIETYTTTNSNRDSFYYLENLKIHGYYGNSLLHVADM